MSKGERERKNVAVYQHRRALLYAFAEGWSVWCAARVPFAGLSRAAMEDRQRPVLAYVPRLQHTDGGVEQPRERGGPWSFHRIYRPQAGGYTDLQLLLKRGE